MTAPLPLPDDSSQSLFTFIRRAALALRMTAEYQGRFPRRKVWRLYWKEAGRMVGRV